MYALLQCAPDCTPQGLVFEWRQCQGLLLAPCSRGAMLAIRGDNDFLVLVWPARADGMDTKLIVNRIVEHKRQEANATTRQREPAKELQRVPRSVCPPIDWDRLKSAS